MAPDRNTVVSPRRAEGRPPKGVPNLYGLVGIASPNASEAEIQKAFEAIVMRKDETPSSSIVAAYSVLSSASKRAQYDRDRLAYLETITNYSDFLAATRTTDASPSSAEEQAERDRSIQQYAALLLDDGRAPDPRGDQLRTVQARLHRSRADLEAFHETARAALEAWPASHNRITRTGAAALRDVLQRARAAVNVLETELGVLRSELLLPLPPTDTDTGGPVGRAAARGQLRSEMKARFRQQQRSPVVPVSGRKGGRAPSPSPPRSPVGGVRMGSRRLCSMPGGSGGGVGATNDGDGEHSSSSSSSSLLEDTSEGMSQTTMPHQERIQKYLVGGPSLGPSSPDITGVLAAIRKSHQADNIILRAQHRHKSGASPVASPGPLSAWANSPAAAAAKKDGGESSKAGQLRGHSPNISPSGSTRPTPLHKSGAESQGVRRQGSRAATSQQPLDELCAKHNSNRSERIAPSTMLTTSLAAGPEHLDEPAPVSTAAAMGPGAGRKQPGLVTPKNDEACSAMGLVAYQEHFGVCKLAATSKKQESATTKTGPSNVHDYAHMTRLLSSTAPERPENYVPHRTTQDSGSPLPLNKRKKHKTRDDWDMKKKEERRNSIQRVVNEKTEAINQGMRDETGLNRGFHKNIDDMLKNMHSAPSLHSSYTLPANPDAPVYAPVYMPPSASSPHSVYMPPTTVPPPPAAAHDTADDFQSKRPGPDVFKRTSRSLKPGGTAGLPRLASLQNAPHERIDWAKINALEDKAQAHAAAAAAAAAAADGPSSSSSADNMDAAAQTIPALARARRAADQKIIDAALHAKSAARVAFGGRAFAAHDTSTLAASAARARAAAQRVADEWTAVRKPKGYGHRYYSRDLRTGAPARAVRPFYFGDAARPAPREVAVAVEQQRKEEEEEEVLMGKEKGVGGRDETEVVAHQRGRRMARAYEGALLRRRTGGLEDPFVD